MRDIVEHSIREAGVRHIDTARMYFNHALIGDGVAAAIEAGAVTRADLFIATKLMPSEMHPECVVECVDASLAELKCDYLDLFMLHWCVIVR